MRHREQHRESRPVLAIEDADRHRLDCLARERLRLVAHRAGAEQEVDAIDERRRIVGERGLRGVVGVEVEQEAGAEVPGRRFGDVEVARHRRLARDLHLGNDQAGAPRFGLRRHVARPEEVEDRRRLQRRLADRQDRIAGEVVGPARRPRLDVERPHPRGDAQDRLAHLPPVRSAGVGAPRASASSRTARTTARRSPRTPCPLSANTAATCCTYAGLGLLVTRRWISCRQKNGAAFGCAKRRSTAILTLASAPVPAGITVPRKRFSLVE